MPRKKFKKSLSPIVTPSTGKMCIFFSAPPVFIKECLLPFTDRTNLINLSSTNKFWNNQLSVLGSRILDYRSMKGSMFPGIYHEINNIYANHVQRRLLLKVLYFPSALEMTAISGSIQNFINLNSLSMSLNFLNSNEALLTQLPKLKNVLLYVPDKEFHSDLEAELTKKFPHLGFTFNIIKSFDKKAFLSLGNAG